MTPRTPTQTLTPAYRCMHEMQTHYPHWGGKTVRDSSRGRVASAGGTSFRRRATQHGKVGSLLGTLQMVSSKTNAPALDTAQRGCTKSSNYRKKQRNASTYNRTNHQANNQSNNQTIKPGETTTQTCSTLTRELLRTKKKRHKKRGAAAAGRQMTHAPHSSVR